MKYLTPIDLNQNELQNGVLQNLASDPGSPLEGQFWQNTTIHHPKIRLNGYTFDLTDALSLSGNNAAFYLSRANHTGTQLASTISNFNAAVQANTLNQFAAAAADLVLGGFKITGLAAGVANTDAVNFAQLQSVQNGTAWLPTPVACIATANITLIGEQTIDGFTTNVSRVAVTNNTVASQNGVYVSAVGAWTRSVDCAAGKNAADLCFFVEQGTTYADSQWRCTNNTGSAVVGTNNLVFGQFGAGTSYTADESTLHLTGNSFSIHSLYSGQTSIVTLGTVATGVWNATPVAVGKGGTNASTPAGARTNLGAIGKYSALIGDGSSTSITITQVTHGLAADGTNTVNIYDAATGAQVFTNVTVVPASGNVTLAFTVAPTTNQYRVVING